MKHNINLRTSFYTRSPKTRREDSPIILRVSLDGQRITIGQIGLSISPRHLVKNRATKESINSIAINTELEKIESKVYFIAEQLYQKGNLDLLSIKEELSGKKTSMQYISVIFNELILSSKQSVQSGNIQERTLKRHENYVKVFMNFLSFTYRKTDILITGITRKVIQDYEEYLKHNLGYCHNTTIKFLWFISRATDFAVNEGILKKDPFKVYSLKQEETDIGFLSESELSVLMHQQIEKKHLAFLRDVFLFSCFTGLSYSDVAKLTQDNIIRLNDEDWIFIRRTKTKVLSQIPLLPQAAVIISKYKEYKTSDGRLFPIPCNQVVNRQLKEIQNLCRITKKLTYHLSRHTFATLALTKGVSLETINKVLGHKRIETTQIYAKIIMPKVSYEMAAFNRRLQAENQINF